LKIAFQPFGYEVSTYIVCKFISIFGEWFRSILEKKSFVTIANSKNN
jgi:hypothetical protein